MTSNRQRPARPRQPRRTRGPSGDPRDQVRRLRAEGGTYRSIAAAAGLAPATVHDLATGRRNPTPSTTRALQKVTSGTLPRARVDAGGTRLRLRALHVMGHGSARIARALGVREMTIRQIVRGDAPTVSPPCATPSPTCTTPGGTSAPPSAPAPSAPPRPPPAAAPSPATGAPAPAWTTTSSTPPATSPGATGNPPPAPAPPPTSTRPTARARTTARDNHSPQTRNHTARKQP